jgi:hypothetical protein
MKPQFTIGTKPSNAGWRAKLEAFADGRGEVVPDPNYTGFPHDLDHVVIGWYDDAVKITFRGAGPAHIAQAYLPGDGRDVIIELKPA